MAFSNSCKRVLRHGSSIDPKPPSRAQSFQALSSFRNSGFLQAVRTREYCCDLPADGIAVWKYALPLPANEPVESLEVHCRSGSLGPSLGDTDWVGIFECVRDRHVEVIPWAAANAIVVAAANTLYIVNPQIPQQFTGLTAAAGINGITFDEAGEQMFIADGIRLYAFSSNRRFKWMSEPIDGYIARFCGCGRRVLAVEVRQCHADLDAQEESSIMRLRTEDGTILRSRFRLAHRYRMMNTAA